MDNNSKENAAVELNKISKLVQDIEKKVALGNIKPKECEDFTILKEKCCESNAIVSLSAFQGIKYLVDKKILIRSQTISMLVSLLPSVKEFRGLVSTIGSILLADFQNQIADNGKYECCYIQQFQHPFLIVLKYNLEKCWFEVYNFILELMKMNEDMIWEHKIEFIRPVFRQIFWSSSWQGSQIQLKLFNALLMEFHKKEVINFTLETLLWQEVNIHFCLFLQEFFIHLLKKESDEVDIIIAGLTPLLAAVTKWVIVKGWNPNLWLKILGTCLERNTASGSTVLFILTDAVVDTPSIYINQLVNICKTIIFSTYCNKYVAYKFVAVILNWFVSPSFLANPLYETLEKILDFINEGGNKWNDQTSKLTDNEYYKKYGSSKNEAKFAVDLIGVCNSWKEGKTSNEDWLKIVRDSNEQQIQLKICSLIQGILLCEKNETVINLCIEILFKLIDWRKEISFSVLCLLFYKLGKEEDPKMQKIYLFSLPKLSVKKENVPHIVGIIESLKRGPSKLMIPLVIQLYLSLWKFDSRTYSYLHKMLHDKTNCEFEWELNVSKAIALKEICRLAPHLHAKDLVGVLSRILNESSGNVSGVPSAIAIEAVTELCKAYVIDVAGTWNAIQPKLCIDRRPEIIVSLCRFFGEIPNLNSTESPNEKFLTDIVSMLWNYTFSENKEIVKSAYQALANFPIENLPLKFLPSIYRVDIKPPKDFEKNSKNTEDILHLPYVPAECWIQFLEKINEEVLQDGGELMMVLVGRELAALPRGLFYNPPEKSEPLSYSYLPPRSICRGLVECLQKYLRTNPLDTPKFLQQIIRILSREYLKCLPPLNWSFLENFMNKGREFSRNCLNLLVKQASVSSSAWSILENHFRYINWDSNQLEDILFFYKLMPILCKSVSYGVLQNFLEQTLKLCLETTLNGKGLYFEEIVECLTKTLKNKAVQSGQKTLIAKQMEKILKLVPHEHEIMTKYAKCATEFPVKLIEEITTIKETTNIESDWLRRAITIRSAIALREDIKNPLVWLSEIIEAVANYPNEQNFVLNAIRVIIQKRRDCDHRPWMNELIWKTQTCIRASESIKATSFFVDVFITATIIFSGYDCLLNADDFLRSESKKLKLFPQAFCHLLSLPTWIDMLPKVGLWLHKLSKWKHLPEDRVSIIIKTLLALREIKSFNIESEDSLFCFSLPAE